MPFALPLRPGGMAQSGAALAASHHRIAWIGSSFYFVWLDNHLKAPAEGEASGEVWSVHGGGFYHKQKYQVAPTTMPDELHWFKWEAYWTWISGFSLLVLIYFFGARTFLIDASKASLNPVEASAHWPRRAGAGLALLRSAVPLEAGQGRPADRHPSGSPS